MEENQNKNPDQNPEPRHSNGYEQYLSQPPAPPSGPDKKKIVLFAVAAVFLLLTGLAVILALIATPGDNPRQANQENEQTAAITCDDEECLNENFSKCQAATFEASDENGATRYELSGEGNQEESTCEVRVLYQSKTDPRQPVQDLTCGLYNRDLELLSALYAALDYPEDYDCQGDLPATETSQP